MTGTAQRERHHQPPSDRARLPLAHLLMPMLSVPAGSRGAGACCSRLALQSPYHRIDMDANARLGQPLLAMRAGQRGRTAAVGAGGGLLTTASCGGTSAAIRGMLYRTRLRRPVRAWRLPGRGVRAADQPIGPSRCHEQGRALLQQHAVDQQPGRRDRRRAGRSALSGRQRAVSAAADIPGARETRRREPLRARVQVAADRPPALSSACSTRSRSRKRPL